MIHQYTYGPHEKTECFYGSEDEEMSAVLKAARKFVKSLEESGDFCHEISARWNDEGSPYAEVRYTV